MSIRIWFQSQFLRLVKVTAVESIKRQRVNLPTDT